jgi:hypothetical protein
MCQKRKEKNPKYNKLCSFCFCNLSQEIHCLALTMIDVTEDQLSGGLTNKECLGLTGGFEFGIQPPPLDDGNDKCAVDKSDFL